MSQTEQEKKPGWYVVHTYSGYENKVASNLEKIIENRKLQNLFFDIRIPVEKVVKVSGENEKEVEHKLYPGYVLVKMIQNDESWHVVRNIRGCTGFVGPDSEPIELTEEEVRKMGVELKTVEITFAEGDMIKVVNGPFANFVGKVESITPDKKKVKAILSLFGRDTPVELDIGDIAKEQL